MLFVAAAGLAAACTAKAEGGQVETKIREHMKELEISVKGVTCPKSIQVKVDATFTCQVTPETGDTFEMKGVVTSKEGTGFKYNLAFVEPQYSAAKLEQILHDGVLEQTKIEPTAVVCGAPGIHRIPDERVVWCDLTAPDGTKVKARFNYDQDGNSTGWEVPPAN